MKSETVYSKDQIEMRNVVRKALYRPLKVMRGRLKQIESKTNQLASLINEENTLRTAITSSSPYKASPMVAINMLAVEALFLLERRAIMNRPKHYGAIHLALSQVERMTMAEMGDANAKVIYSKHDDAEIANTIAKLEEEYTDELTNITE